MQFQIFGHFKTSETLNCFSSMYITKDYKKVEDKLVDDIAKKYKVVATKLEIEDRLYCTSKHDSFITIKDHKSNYMSNPECRLIK